jgi:murein DD-endopeptidase MepM/ murein hydrolase activator NlpD
MRATSDGTIVYVGDDGLGGMTVDLLRGDGLLQRFGHLSAYRVRNNQPVRAGDVIALSGNTGMSTGPHLHWELRWDRRWVGGKWVDPRNITPPLLNFNEIPEPLPKEFDPMKNYGIFWKDGAMFRVAIINTGSGLFQEYSTGSAAYNNKIAKALGTGSFLEITKAHYNAFRSDMAKVRAGVA